MAFLFTGFDGDSSLILKSKESACFQVGDWRQLKVAFQCSLLPTGSFSAISGNNGAGITGNIQSANSNRDFIYFGVKENNFSFPQSGLYNQSGSASFLGNYIGYTNKTSLSIDANSVTSYDNPDVYFSPYLLYQSPNNSGISASSSDFYIHNNDTNHVATNVFDFIIGNENQSNQIIECTYSSNTSKQILGSGDMIELLSSATLNNQIVNWGTNNGVLPNQIFFYNGNNNFYLRLHALAIQKTPKQYSSEIIINSGAFISFDNAVNSVVMESPHQLNQCQFFIGTGLSGVSSYSNNNVGFSFKNFWSGAYIDFSGMSTGNYSGLSPVIDKTWYPSTNINHYFLSF